MSQTTDFVNNQVTLLQSKIKEYQADIDDANAKVASCIAKISDLQSQIDGFNNELQKVQITDDQLTAAMGVANAKPATIL